MNHSLGRVAAGLCCALAAWLASAGEAQAQAGSSARLPAPPRPVRPADEDDLSLPPEPTRVVPGDGRRVLVSSGGASPVVARLHCEVDDRFLVILPDGRLRSVRAREATPTDRPFVAATKDEIAARLTSEQFKGFKTRQTKYFLYIYNTSDTFYAGTSRILETMYPGLFAICKRQGIEVHNPEVPLVVIMFRTRSEFSAYSGAPDGVAAYYSPISNHVVMYEQSRLSEVAPEIAVKDAISTVAHEGVHQILQNIGVQQRLSRWPMWLSEGLAEYFAPTELSSTIRWKGVGMVNDLRMKELETYILVTGTRIRTGDTVRATVRAPSLSSTGYASAWSLAHYLGSRKQKDFYAYVKEHTRIGPLERPTTDENERLFRRYFGDDYAALERALAAHLQSLPYVDPFR